MTLTYLLPIKRTTRAPDDDLDTYVNSLPCAEIIVVDGSPPEVFDEHHRRWPAVRHVRPGADDAGRNGKSWGVRTGLRLATHPCVVIADDDVRYDAASLNGVLRALERADVVRPQNYFRPRAWHTYLDEGRTLFNRVTGGDWPGTLAVRRSFLPDGYDSDVLFENFELVRTVRANGGRECVAAGLYVERRPPTARHFAAQRVRQAYDEFARPPRLVAALAVLPLCAFLAIRRHRRLLGVCALGIALVAEAGRRKAGGAKIFSPWSSLAAPVWMLERGVCAWLALAMRVAYGGMPYAGTVLVRAANR